MRRNDPRKRDPHGWGGAAPAPNSRPQAVPYMVPGAVNAVSVQGPLTGAFCPLGRSRPVEFGVVIYDLETIHDAERGIYADAGMYECDRSEQIVWKRRSQVIEFAAMDLRSGARLQVSCRPRFKWDDVKSPAARRFAEDHGHDRIVKDQSLPYFEVRWTDEIMPFLEKAAGKFGRLAMIAHNGDNFDHYVLDKELCRLKLNPSDKLYLHRFDPVRTLKTLHGEDFGTGGQLRLEKLHATHVPEEIAEATDDKHQALNDCQMLREVLAHWQHLAGALAFEISRAFSAHGGEIAEGYLQVANFFGYQREEPSAAAEGSEASTEVPEGLPGYGLYTGSAEFVPGVPWALHQGVAMMPQAPQASSMQFQ